MANHALAIAEIDAAIARLQGAKAELLRAETEESTPWCTPAEYAAHARVCSDTVRNWVMAGMPAVDVKKDRDGRIVGTRKSTRINRIEADAWRQTR